MDPSAWTARASTLRRPRLDQGPQNRREAQDPDAAPPLFSKQQATAPRLRLEAGAANSSTIPTIIVTFDRTAHFL